MDLIKDYEMQCEAMEKDIKTLTVAGIGVEYKIGQLTQLKMVIRDLKKQKIADRFFLEEIVHAIQRNDDEYYQTLTRDFLKEYVGETPLNEAQRDHYIDVILGLPRNYFFESEMHLEYFLDRGSIPDEASLRNYKIEKIVE